MNVVVLMANYHDYDYYDNNGNDHGQEIKDGVFALVDDFPTFKDVILVYQS